MRILKDVDPDHDDDSGLMLVDKPAIYIPQLLVDVMWNIDMQKKVSSNSEFSIFCIADIDGFEITLKPKYFIPEQVVHSAEVDYKEQRPNHRYNTVIHRHPNNMNNFSGGDDRYINRNFDVSILWTANEEFVKGQYNLFQHGQRIRLDCDLYIMRNEFVIKDIMKIKTRPSYTPTASTTSTTPMSIGQGLHRVEDGCYVSDVRLSFMDDKYKWNWLHSGYQSEWGFENCEARKAYYNETNRGHQTNIFPTSTTSDYSGYDNYDSNAGADITWVDDAFKFLAGLPRSKKQTKIAKHFHDYVLRLMSHDDKPMALINPLDKDFAELMWITIWSAQAMLWDKKYIMDLLKALTLFWSEQLYQKVYDRAELCFKYAHSEIIKTPILNAKDKVNLKKSLIEVPKLTQ